jgi:DNA polymerase-3 subunit epsilon
MGDWHRGRMACFDIESSGIDPHRDRIVTAAVTEVGGGAKTQTRSWLLDPVIDIPEGATAIHGIPTDYARENGRPAVTGVQEIAMDLLSCSRSGLPIVGHNVVYDITMLYCELLRHKHHPLANSIAMLRPVIDTLVLSKWLQPYRPKQPTKRTPDPAKCGSYNLVDSCRINGIELSEEEAHGAEADALAAGRLAWKLAHTYPGAQGSAIALHDWQIEEKARQDEGFADWLRKQGKDASDVTGQWPLVLPPADWSPEQLPAVREDVAS